MNDTITIAGNVGTRPEHKQLPDGTPITTFRLATSRRRFDKATNAWIDSDKNWYSISTYRLLAEHVYRSLNVGERVLLTGRLKLREWESGGKKGFSADIDADAIGHDLMFGTTSFARDPRWQREENTVDSSDPSAGADEVAREWNADASNATSWADPVAAIVATAETAASQSDALERGPREFADADTPF